jgi:hypothetical protein
LSEDNEGSYNNSDQKKRKDDDVVSAQYVKATNKLTKTYKDGTIGVVS